MRIWSTRSPAETDRARPGEAIVEAVDAALGFVAGQRWVPRRLAEALLETVRDAAREVGAPELVDAAIDRMPDEGEDRVLAVQLTDLLLDIRNASRLREAHSAGA